MIVTVAALIVDGDLLEDLFSDRRVVSSSRIIVAEGHLTPVVVLTNHQGIYYGHSIFIKRKAD